MDVPATLYAQTFTTRQRETLDRLANYIEDYILITPEAGAIASAVAGHAALTSGVHGISAFGATLVDDASASAARTTLGLGTAALQNVASMEDLRFPAGYSLIFQNNLFGSQLEQGVNDPAGTCLYLKGGSGTLLTDHLIGYDASNGAFHTTPDYWTLAYKSATDVRTVLLVTASFTAGGSTLAFDGDITVAQGATSYNVGYKDVPLNVQNATYTYALTDRSFGVGKNDTTAYTHTVPPNASVAFPTGSVIAYFNDGSAGDLTIAQGAGVTIVLDGTTTTGNRTVAAGGTGRLWKVSTDRWICGGSGTT